MTTMWGIIFLMALVALLGSGWVFGAAWPARGLAAMVTHKIELPEDAIRWMIPNYRRSEWGCAMFPVFIASLVSATYASGAFGLTGAVALGVVSAIVAFVVAGVIGQQFAKPRGNIAPILAEFAGQAEQRAVSFAEDGDSEQAAAALRLADWTRDLAANGRDLTVARFKRYYTAFQVATILWDRFFGGTDEHELDRWLATANEMLYEGPDEARRVELLDQVQNAVARIDHHRPTDLHDRERVRERVRELINRLEADLSAS